MLWEDLNNSIFKPYEMYISIKSNNSYLCSGVSLKALIIYQSS